MTRRLQRAAGQSLVDDRGDRVGEKLLTTNKAWIHLAVSDDAEEDPEHG